MRRSIFVLFALSSLLLSNCSRSNEIPLCCVIPDRGYSIIAQRNGTNWVSASYTATLVQDSLKITAGSDYENINIKIKITGAGQYALTGNQVLYHNTSAQGSILTNYILDNTLASSFNVISYNQAANIIEGSLNITLVKTYEVTGISYPSNLSFLNGNFRLQLAK